MHLDANRLEITSNLIAKVLAIERRHQSNTTCGPLATTKIMNNLYAIVFLQIRCKPLPEIEGGRQCLQPHCELGIISTK